MLQEFSMIWFGKSMWAFVCVVHKKRLCVRRIHAIGGQITAFNPRFRKSFGLLVSVNLVSIVLLATENARKRFNGRINYSDWLGARQKEDENKGNTEATAGSADAIWMPSKQSYHYTTKRIKNIVVIMLYSWGPHCCRHSQWAKCQEKNLNFKWA